MDLARSLNRIILQEPTEPHLDLGALRNQLQHLDESSLGDLLAFKKDLENKLRTTAGLLQTDLPCRVIRARDLTRDEVFTHFSLKDTVNDNGVHVIPEWNPPGAPGVCSEWLARGLNLSVDIFRAKTADITAIINLMILDVIHDLPEFQVLDHFKSGETAPEKPPSVITFTPGEPYLVAPRRLKIRTYKQQPMSVLTGSGENPTSIVGAIDAAFSCGYIMKSNATFLSTHLVVLKKKRGRMMMVNRLVHDSTNELCAYLATIQLGQEDWYKQSASERGRFGVGIGYGVVSDGEWCRFIEVKGDKTVRFGDVLMIKYDIHKILQYLRYIFAAIVADYIPRG